MHGLKRFALGATLGALAAAGCSGSGDGGGAGGMGGYGVEPPAAESYYPEKVGNSWTYWVTPVAVELPTYKVITVDALETVGGTGASAARPAFRHTTCKSALTLEACSKPPSATNSVDRTVGWMGMADRTLANYREESFKKGTEMLVQEDWWEPFRTKVDMSPAHTMAGAQWTEKFTEVKRPTDGGPTTRVPQTETWTVLGADESVVITPPGGAPKTYEHCLVVQHTTTSGKVLKKFWYARGIGKVKETGSQTEELIDYKVQP
jgi:hypothetical protein